MAAAVNIDSFDLYSCEVCFESLLDLERKPRTLQCNHTFCSPCLSNLIHHGYIQCPKCRSSSKVRNVDDLPVNIDISKMKEREEEIMKSKEESCFRCFKEGNLVPASANCKQCKRKMCSKCLEYHNNTPVFSKHVIEEIRVLPLSFAKCRVHHMAAEYVCLLCTEGICVDCVFEDTHGSHKSYVEEIGAGKAKVKQAFAVVGDRIKQICSKIEDLAQFIDNSSKNNIEEEKAQSKGEEIANSMRCSVLLKEIENCIELGLKYYAQATAETKKLLNKARIKVSQVSALTDKEFITGLQQIQGDLHKLLEDAQQHVSPTGIREWIVDFEYQPSNSDIWTPGTPKLVKYIPSNMPNVKLVQPSEIDTDGECLAISDHTLPYIQILSLQGQLIGTYYPVSDAASEINGVQLVRGILYIAQNTGISIIPLANPGQGRYVKPRVSSIATIAVLNETCIFIVDSEKETVVRYNSQTEAVTVVTEGFQFPNYISVGMVSNKVHFAVTDTGTCRITVFNETWDCVARITRPQVDFGLTGTAFLPNGHLLVAEGCRSLITEYSIPIQKQPAQRCVLSQKDMVRFPDCMAFRKNALCFTESNIDYAAPNERHVAVRIYKLGSK